MLDQELRYQDCYFTREGDTVTLGNSRIERVWRIGPSGFSTIHFVDKRTGRDWAAEGCRESVMTTETGNISLSALTVDDVFAEQIQTPISAACLRVTFRLHSDGLRIRKCFDLYPDTPAIRAWLEVTSDADRSSFDYTQVEAMSLELANAQATAVELHDLTDTTNHLATVRQTDLAEPRKMIGNYVFIEEHAGDGVFAYKESPVPNSQLYHLYYDSAADAQGMAGVGAGFHNLPAGKTRRTYAFAIGVYSGGRDGGILALKEYQAARYRLQPDRDYIVSANSWGAFHEDIDEAKMIAEVEAAAEMGIESVAVDAGWTHNIMGGDPDPEKFPQGFGPLAARARELGVKLELWMVPNRLHDQLDVLQEHGDWIARTNNLVPCDTLKSYWDTQLVGIELCNEDCFQWMKSYFLKFYDQGFHRFKMDTFQCDGYDTLVGDLSDHYEALRRLMHELVVERPGLTFTQDSTRTNRPIYDYYMDYGVIFLENRYMPRPPEHNGRYHPWKTLRNLWQIAPYIPPQKINLELIEDQEGYSPEYLLATVMMANPLFWEALAEASEESRAAMKRAVALYKQHRQGIYSGAIFPIGDMPDGFSWTGFQSHNPKTQSGYVIFYREDNEDESHTFQLKHLTQPTQFISVTDSSPAITCDCPTDGVEIALPAKRAFRLYRYETTGK